MLNKISKDEQKLFKSFLYHSGVLNGNQKEKYDDDQKFKILLGEWEAGNDSDIIKKELRKYVLRAIKENQITKEVGYKYLVELS